MAAHLPKLADLNKLAKTTGFDLNCICRQLKISRRTLERHFEQNLLETPAQWIQRLCLEEAAHLLRQGLVAKEICGRLGFTSESNFSHQFRRYFGSTPTEYLRHSIATSAGMADDISRPSTARI
jgi:AraC family transcriptional regulator, regulatory protein of adaptative response / methylphosphotriester-DNA alkyltransferase methyltransferase